MRRSRLNNAAFILLVLAALAASAWAVFARSGAVLPAPADISERLERVEAPARQEGERRPAGRIERMIESGELSNRPARFWRGEGESGGER